MAISLTTDGLRLDYRTSVQESVSGTYPIGTVIVADTDRYTSLSLPGTWASYELYKSGAHSYRGETSMGSSLSTSGAMYSRHLAIRVS